jgi:hypothetical protein
MEILAMEMKFRGMFICRQLSFKGSSFKIEEVKFSSSFIRVYDKSVKLWVQFVESFTEVFHLLKVDLNMRKTIWTQFWAAHQRFFKLLIIAAKVKHTIKLAKKSVKNGKCAVIALQSTGEARTLAQLKDGEVSDFISTAQGVLKSLIENHFPSYHKDRLSDRKSLLSTPHSGVKRKADIELATPKSKRTKTSDSKSDKHDKKEAKPTVASAIKTVENHKVKRSIFANKGDSERGKKYFRYYGYCPHIFY